MSEQARRPRFLPWLAGAAVVAIAAMAVWPSLGGGFVLDDVPALLENPNARWPPDVRAIFTQPYWGARPGASTIPIIRPLTTLSFALDHGIHGLNPLGVRLHNLLWHLGAVGLVWILARRLLPFTWALLAAAWFGAMPAHVEAVASAANRTELIAAVGWLGALLAFDAGLRRGRAHDFVMCCALYALSWGGKETAITFPLAAFVWWALAPNGVGVGQGRGERWGGFISARRLGVAAALAAITGAALAWRAAVLVSPFGGNTPLPDNPLVAEGIGTRMLTAFSLVGTAAESLLLPLRLSADYTQAALPVESWPPGPMAWLGLTASMLAAWALWRSARAPAVAVGVALAAVAYSLASQTLVLSSVIFSDRSLYMPSAGLSIALCGLGAAAEAHWPALSTPWTRRLVIGAAWCFIALQGAQSWRYVGAWTHNESLYEWSLRSRPLSGRMLANLGHLRLEQGRMGEAETLLSSAVEISPLSATAWLNLGEVYRRSHRPEQARGAYERALECLDGRFALAWSNLCLLSFDAQQFEQAQQECERAVQLRPQLAEAQGLLGELAARRGEGELAEKYFRAGLAVEPNHPWLLRRFGALLHDWGRYEELTEPLALTLPTEKQDHKARAAHCAEWVRVAELARAQAFERGDPNAAFRHARGPAAAGCAGAAPAMSLAAEAARLSLPIAHWQWSARVALERPNGPKGAR